MENTMKLAPYLGRNNKLLFQTGLKEMSER